MNKAFISFLYAWFCLSIGSYIFSTFVFVGDRFLSLVRSQRVQCFEATASKPAFICSKLTIERQEQGVKYVQS